MLGGGGTNGPTNTYGTDTADDKPQAKVITTRNAVVGTEATGFSKNGWAAPKAQEAYAG